MVPKQLNDRVFDLVTDVYGQKRRERLALYVDHVRQRELPIDVKRLNVGQFVLLIQVKLLAQKGYGQGDIRATLKAHPYRVKLALRQVGVYAYHQLAQAYSGLVDTETAMNSGTIDKALAFELFNVKYTGQASAHVKGKYTASRS